MAISDIGEAVLQALLLLLTYVLAVVWETTKYISSKLRASSIE
jgi:hypothetical protein